MRLFTLENGIPTLTPDQQHPPGPYAILSHTWGSDDEEVTFEEVDLPHTKAGWRKIDFCLEQARRDGLKYVWIDSCCINRTNSSELIEAINRMYDFYAEAKVCYVYLSDISDAFGPSRWFTRGWTLQELVAPISVRFYSNEWLFLGDKRTLAQAILDISGIDINVPLEHVPHVQRFRWALERQTRKPEDMSYCLLGLLEVTMTANYGEGGDGAMKRLFREVKSEHGRRVETELRQAWEAHRIQQRQPGMCKSTTIRNQTSKEDLLNSLLFPNMSARRALIEDPHPGTCTWLLKHDYYQRWSATNNDHFLWLKGKPGAGKSTLVKFTDMESAKEEHAHLQISFYFNARGSNPLEHSTEGMYRSLLYQLLRTVPEVSNTVAKVIDNALQYGPWSWTIQSLQSALNAATSMVRQPLRCFIDALDECEDEIKVQSMVHFLQNLTMQNANIYVFFASRYYPTVSIPNSLEILLDQQHTDDLKLYVGRRLEATGSFGVSLREQIIAKANGIFMWTVLVVRILNHEIARGNDHNVQKVLDDLPDELHGLLREIVSRHSDDVEQFRLCLQLLIYGFVGMEQVDVFYTAMMTGLSELKMTHISSFIHLHSDDMPPKEVLSKFISTSSRGLAELTVYNEVQFIHQSVRDYLIKHEGLQLIHQHVQTDLTSWIHNRLTSLCVHYISVGPFSDVDILGSIMLEEFGPWRSIHTAVHSLFDELPFLFYVCAETISHAEIAAMHISQDDFISRYISQHIKPLSSFLDVAPQEDLSLGHSVARAGASRLIRAMHSLGLDCITPLNKPSLAVAAYYGQDHAIRVLLDIGADLEARDEEGQTALWYVCDFNESYDDDSRLISLAALGLNINARDYQGRSVLFESTRHIFDWSLVDCVSRLGLDLELKDVLGMTAVMSSLHPQSTWQLWRAGADLEARDMAGRTALICACDSKSWDCVKALLFAGADINAVDNNGRTALTWTRSVMAPEWIREELLAFDVLQRQGLERLLQENQDLLQNNQDRNSECFRILLWIAEQRTFCSEFAYDCTQELDVPFHWRDLSNDEGASLARAMGSERLTRLRQAEQAIHH